MDFLNRKHYLAFFRINSLSDLLLDIISCSGLQKIPILKLYFFMFSRRFSFCCCKSAEHNIVFDLFRLKKKNWLNTAYNYGRDFPLTSFQWNENETENTHSDRPTEKKTSVTQCVVYGHQNKSYTKKPTNKQTYIQTYINIFICFACPINMSTTIS